MSSRVRLVLAFLLLLFALSGRDPAAQSPLPTLDRSQPDGSRGDRRPRAADVDGVHRRQRVPGARKGDRPRQARDQRRACADRPGSRRQQRVRARAARHCAASAVRDQPVRLSVLVLLGVARPSSTFQVSATTCPATSGDRADTAEIVYGPAFREIASTDSCGTVQPCRFDRNLITLRSFQNDVTNGVPRGNHDGGVIRFGGDGKLYVIFGDNGRRGQMQNLINGASGDGSSDDQFGGPGPDRAHFTGVILRLNDDGSAPSDNPFFALGARHRRRRRRQPAEDLRLRCSQQFRDGVRSGFGRSLGSAEW